jgi:hypothetical protein
MKGRLFTIAAALSLLLSLAAVFAWATSYAQSTRWRLIATAHSADLTKLSSERGTALFTTVPDWTTPDHHGFWDAWWMLSKSGRLTLVAQVVDYDGTLRRISSSPPSLTVEAPGPTPAQPAVVARVHNDEAVKSWLGFASHSDTQTVDGANGPVTARAWMITVPYWFILLVGLPIPLLWRRARRRRSGVDPVDLRHA